MVSGRNTPLVAQRLVERHPVLVVRQTLAPRADAEVPRTRRDQVGLELGAERAQLLDAARPVVAAGAALIAEAAEDSPCASTWRRGCGTAGCRCRSAAAPVDTGRRSPRTARWRRREVMVHQVVTELAAVVAEAVREATRLRVEQDARRAERRRAQEDDAREVLARSAWSRRRSTPTPWPDRASRRR